MFLKSVVETVSSDSSVLPFIDEMPMIAYAALEDRPYTDWMSECRPFAALIVACAIEPEWLPKSNGMIVNAVGVSPAALACLISAGPSPSGPLVVVPKVRYVLIPGLFFC